MHVDVVVLVGVEGKAEEGADNPSTVPGESLRSGVVGGVMEEKDEAAYEHEHLDRDIEPSR